MARDPKNKNTPIYGKTWQEFQRDPNLQREFMRVATQDYVSKLGQNKVPVTGGTLYMAHHFGPDMAVKMYNAGPQAKMSDFYPEYVTRKNPRTGQVEKVPNPVYAQNPALKPNQTVQYTHDRLDKSLTSRDKTNTLAGLDKTNLWSGTGATAVAAATGSAGQAAKPADQTTFGQRMDKIVQAEPRYYKRGELGINQYMQNAQQEVDRLRASAQRVPSAQVQTIPATTTPAMTVPTTPSAGQVPSNDNLAKTDDEVEKKTTVPVSESNTISVNKKTDYNDLKYLLTLAGKK